MMDGQTNTNGQTNSRGTVIQLRGTDKENRFICFEMHKAKITTCVLEFSESSCVSSTSHTNKIFCLKLWSWSFPFFAALKLWCLGLFSLTLRWQLVQSQIWPKENSCKTQEDEVRAVTSGFFSCFHCTFFSIRTTLRFGPLGHRFEYSGNSKQGQNEKLPSLNN